MAKDCSFDVVSEVDMQEVDNAVNQAKKRLVHAMISVVLKRKLALKVTLSKSSVMMNIIERHYRCIKRQNG